MTTDGVQLSSLFSSAHCAEPVGEHHDEPECEKAKQAVGVLVKMAASKRLQKQPECKMCACGTRWRETTPMLFGLSFSEDFFLVSEI